MSSRIYTLMLFTPLVEICILNDRGEWCGTGL